MGANRPRPNHRSRTGAFDMFDLARLSPLFARWRRRVIFWLPGLLGLFLLLSGAGTGLDQLLRNMRDGIRSHPASGELHIVEIDARSLAEFGKWPLPSRIHDRSDERRVGKGGVSTCRSWRVTYQ